MCVVTLSGGIGVLRARDSVNLACMRKDLCYNLYGYLVRADKKTILLVERETRP